MIQRVGAFGFINTKKVKIEDLEYYEKDNFVKENYGLFRFSRPFVDDKMLFKIKSTGEILTFDRDGYWFEEGINHRLMV